MTPGRLFLYGTLMAGHGHRVARRLHDVLAPGGAAQVSGRLVAIPNPGGWYPALLAGAGVVRGMVHAADGLDAALLADLDAYEQVVRVGAGYRRAEVMVAGVGPAMAYVWQGALPPGAVALEEGDFAAFLARTGQRPYGAQLS
jgi:gamma-glutamylcyclotransferase (GGCT)/AIG2-like uncharacterized protein YtfP